MPSNRDWISSIFFLFFSTLVVALFLYWIGGRVGVKGKKSSDKVSTYACGEDLPSRQVQVDVERFFIYAVYFLIFDVLAVFLATSLNTPGFFPALYGTEADDMRHIVSILHPACSSCLTLRVYPCPV